MVDFFLSRRATNRESPSKRGVHYKRFSKAPMSKENYKLIFQKNSNTWDWGHHVSFPFCVTPAGTVDIIDLPYQMPVIYRHVHMLKDYKLCQGIN